MTHGERDEVRKNGFRLNVCIVLCNDHDDVLFAKREDRLNSWQFPQGGIKKHESFEDAMYRELEEEIGLQPRHVRVLGAAPRKMRYRTPPEYVKDHRFPHKGQIQKWFLLRMLYPDHVVNLKPTSEEQEFTNWAWVNYWYPAQTVVRFKQRVYRDGLEQLAPLLRE